MFKEVFESSEEQTGSLHQHKETGRLWVHNVSLKTSFHFGKSLIILWRPGSCESPGHYSSSSHYYFCFFHNLNVPRLPVCATSRCQSHSCRGGVYSSLRPEQEQITNSHILLALYGKSHLLSTQCRGIPSLSSFVFRVHWISNIWTNLFEKNTEFFNSPAFYSLSSLSFFIETVLH